MEYEKTTEKKRHAFSGEQNIDFSRHRWKINFLHICSQMHSASFSKRLMGIKSGGNEFSGTGRLGSLEPDTVYRSHKLNLRMCCKRIWH